MPLSEPHHHRHGCDCAGHRHAAVPSEQRVGWWSALLPALACAVCPACLTMYAKMLSVLGIGFGMSELQHSLLLTFAVAVSVAVSAWRTIRSKRVWPLATALVGTALVVCGHMSGDLHEVEWLGVFVLLAGGLAEQFRLRRLVQVQAA